MILFPSVLFLNFIGLLCPLNSNHFNFQEETKEQNEVESGIHSGIAKLRKLESKSFHRYLRDADVIFPKLCIGKSWTEVTKALEARMCSSVWESTNHGKVVRKCYLVKKDTFPSTAGVSFDTCIYLSRREKQNFDGGEVPDNVFTCDVVLQSGQLEIDVKDLKALFPEHNVLDAAIGSEATQSEAKLRPYLQKVQIHFGRRVTREPVSGNGFFIELELTTDKSGKQSRKRLSLGVASGLKSKPTIKSDSADTFGKVEFIGSAGGK